MALRPSRRRVLRTLGAAVVASTAGCSSLSESSLSKPPTPEQVSPDRLGGDWRPRPGTWPLPGGNVRNTRQTADPGPGRDAAVRWSNGGGGEGDSDAVPDSLAVGAVVDGDVYARVYAAESESFGLLALDAADGTVRRRRSLSAEPVSPPVLRDGVLYAAGRAGVAAYDAETLATRWTVDLYGRLREVVHPAFLPDDRERFHASTPVVGRGRVHVASSFGLHTFDVGDGTERGRVWAGDAGEVRLGRPVLGDDWVALTSVVGEERVFQIRDGGDVLRLTDDADTFLTAPAFADGRLVVAHAGQTFAETPFTLRAVDAAGDPDVHSWTFLGHGTSAPGGRANTVPAVGTDRVYVGDTILTADGLVSTLYALDPRDGIAAWSVPLPVENVSPNDPRVTRTVTAPTLSADSLYVGVATEVDGLEDRVVPESAGVLAVDPTTGDRQWSLRLGFLPEGLTVAGGALVAWDRDGRVAVVS
jgi:outer membrane protein assembly factor BamB